MYQVPSTFTSHQPWGVRPPWVLETFPTQSFVSKSIFFGQKKAFRTPHMVMSPSAEAIELARMMTRQTGARYLRQKR